MNAPLRGHARLVIVGATGMVGGDALRMRSTTRLSELTAIGRRSVGIAHPKLKEVLHHDFADCSVLGMRLVLIEVKVCDTHARGFAHP